MGRGERVPAQVWGAEGGDRDRGAHGRAAAACKPPQGDQAASKRVVQRGKLPKRVGERCRERCTLLLGGLQSLAQF